MNIRRLYLALALLGLFIPNSAFWSWLRTHGLDPERFVQDLFSNGVSAFFGLDVILSALVLSAFVLIEGKRLGVVDDSIVRGNTQRALVRMLREAGAIEVHIRISSPPVKWPCFFGIDFASRAELIANGLSVEEIRRSLGADSLAYISLEGMIAATHVPGERLCRACFDGMYPIKLPEPELLGKHLLERVPAPGHRGQAHLRRPRRGPAEVRPDLDEAERAQAPPATEPRAPMPGAARD